MEKYHYLKRITKSDLYKVLRYKYPLSFQRIAKRDQQHEVVIFRETIDLLENYDRLLLMLKNDQEPTLDELPYLTNEQRVELNKGINGLKYSRNVLTERDHLDFFVFRKISQYLGLSNGVDQSSHGIIRGMNMHLGQGAMKLCADSYSSIAGEFKDYELNVFLGFLEKLKPKVLADSSIYDQFHLTTDEEDYEQRFKKVLSEYKQMYVLCLDINIGKIESKCDDNYDQLYLDYQEKLNRILQKIDGLNTLIHYLCKLEPSQEFGFNLHLVLVLNEDKFFSENTFVAKLKNELSGGINILSDRLVIRNWNEIIRKNFSKKAVGLIKNGDLPALNENWYWVFSYFFIVNQVIKFNVGFDIDQLRVPDEAPSDDLITSSSHNADEIKSENSGLFVSRKHLAKPAQQYLSYVDLTYLEYSYLSVNEGGHLTIGHLLGRIEVFCETLKAVKPELFIIPNKALLGIFSPEEYSKMRTRLGRMWLDIFKTLLDEPELLQHLLNAPFRSQNVVSFLNFLQENRDELQQLHSQQLNEPAIFQLNEKLSLLKNELVYPKKSTHGVLDGRLKDLTKYVRYLLAKDVYVLRIRIEFTIQNKSLSQAEQSPILTELLRVGQSAQPLCWLRGYLLRWDQYDCVQRQSRQTYADLTLFFEYQPKLQDVNLTEMLKQYLAKFIIRYSEKKKLSNSANEIHYSMRSCNVFTPKAELRHEVLKIETIDKDLRKSFMKYYLPYFCFLDFFILWVEMGNAKKIKRYTKGQEPKSKKISTTEDSQ
ncbi:hypothetical protein [Acinetobacter beijerinckii]|uniref:hypothetical protein n=1 Tax=Acinetobacter beijerinckii TaxID=262668 RepID=UPI00300B75A6